MRRTDTHGYENILRTANLKYHVIDRKQKSREVTQKKKKSEK